MSDALLNGETKTPAAISRSQRPRRFVQPSCAISAVSMIYDERKQARRDKLVLVMLCS
jgi:hypothetical protein